MLTEGGKEVNMPKTPKFKSLREAYVYCTGRTVEEPHESIYEPSWVEQWARWDKKQKALKEEQTAE